MPAGQPRGTRQERAAPPCLEQKRPAPLCSVQQWSKASFRKRLELQGEASKKIPRGTVGEAIGRCIGIDEACSSCDDRVKKYRPEVRCRVLRRFSGPELRKTVQETLEARASVIAALKTKAKPVKEEEEFEEESDSESTPDVTAIGEEPDYDPPTSPDGGASGAATATPAVAVAA